MNWTVSVRDINMLEKGLAEGAVPLPDECRHNSAVIYTFLDRYASKALPGWAAFSDGDKRLFADTVAYLLRPDLIKNQYAPVGPSLLQEMEPRPQMPEGASPGTEDGLALILLESPDTITPEFELDHADGAAMLRGAEYFRCYGAAFDFTRLHRKLGENLSCLTPAFPLADITAYLLSPVNLTDYAYSRPEVDNFHRTLAKEMREI